MPDKIADPVDAALEQLGHDFVPKGEEETETPEPVEEKEELTPAQTAAAERADKFKYEQEMARIEKERGDLNFAKEHIDFIREVQGNQALKEHILKFYAGQAGRQPEAPAQPAPEEQDLLETMDPEDKKYVNAIMEKVMAKVREELAPIRDVAGSVVQERQTQKGRAEMAQLNEEFPDWQSHVDPKDLAEAKRMKPDLPIATIYRILSYDKVYADRSRSRKVLEEKLGRTAAPEAGGKPRQELRPKALTKDDAFEAALKQFPLLAGGRR